jgi:hypothetical protein
MHKPGRVACLNAGGVKTEEGPGAAMGCFATCRAEITTAWDPWYLYTSHICHNLFPEEEKDDLVFA